MYNFQFRRLGVLYTVIFTRAVREPLTITLVPLCEERLETHAIKQMRNGSDYECVMPQSLNV
jgi:hypothetical protein